MANPSVVNFGPRALGAGGVVHKKYQHNGLRVINKSGSDIAIDKLVAVIGFDVTSERPKIVLASADTAGHEDVYVTLSAIANNAEGIVFKGGRSAANLNTNSATTAGDPVFLSATAGAFAHSQPQNTVIPAGWVVTKSATVGDIYWNIGPSHVFGVSNNF